MDTSSVIDKRLPIYQRVRDELARKIASGEWRPGAMIPPEQELARESGVSVGTLRKAIELLTSEGLIERFQGRGTFVRRISFDGSLFRFFRVEKASGERVIPKSIILKRELKRAPLMVSQALCLPAGAMVIHMKRSRTIEDRIVLLEEIWLPHQPFQRFFEVGLSEIGDLLYPEYERYAGQIVASAEETLTVDIVRKSEVERFRLKIGTPVIVIERVAHGYDGSPIEWRRSRGPATRFRYKVEIR